MPAAAITAVDHLWPQVSATAGKAAHRRPRSHGEKHRDAHRSEARTLEHALESPRRPHSAAIPTLDPLLSSRMVRGLELFTPAADKCLTRRTISGNWTSSTRCCSMTEILRCGNEGASSLFNRNCSQRPTGCGDSQRARDGSRRTRSRTSPATSREHPGLL